MEPLLKQMTELPKSFAALPGRTKFLSGLFLGLVAILALATYFVANGGTYQYVYSNLSPEDSAEAAQVLKQNSIPFRVEASGAALAVPEAQLHDARLLLATAGLPRGGAQGFELFDKGDLGVSDFTQKVNLRRATEGELARTIGRLSGVRSARVHVTMSEKGLFRNDDRQASAAVVVNLQPGRTLNEKELAGVRHLVASAVPSLVADAVTIVDGRGAVLVAESNWGEDVTGYQKRLERDLEQRVIGMLEPVVGVGQVVARVTATVDASEVNTTADVVDPDATAVRSERTLAQAQQQDSNTNSGLAGAAANQPLVQNSQTGGTGQKSNSTTQEETRNYEVSKTVTKTVTRAPRLQRISVAILLDGVDGKPRTEQEVLHLGDIAKRAVGFEATRGDMFEISSSVFAHSPEPAAVVEQFAWAKKPIVLFLAIGGLALLTALVLGVLVLRGRKPAVTPEVVPQLVVGQKVAEIEASSQVNPKPLELPEAKKPEDPSKEHQNRARQLAQADPTRAAQLLRAWIASDAESKEAARG